MTLTNTNPSQGSDKNFGFYQCMANDFIVYKCVPSIIYLIASLIIEIFLIIYLYENLKFKPKIWRKKNIIFGTLILGNLAYFIYNFSRTLEPVYFFQDFFISLQLSLIIYYFASKAFKIIQSERTKKIVKGAFGVLLAYDVTILFYNFYQYFEDSSEKVCKSNSWTYIRAVELFLTIIFAGVGRYISNQMEEQLKKLKIQSNNGEPEITQLPSPLLDNINFQFKHKASMKRNIWMLIIINLVSGIVLNVKNILFLYNGRSDCRIIPHGSGGTDDWEDYLEAVVGFFIKVITYFLPLAASILVFRLRTEEKQTFSQEEYYEGGIYTTALGMKPRKHDWEDEDDEFKKTPPQNPHSNSSISLGVERKSSRTSEKINVIEGRTKSINSTNPVSY